MSINIPGVFGRLWRVAKRPTMTVIGAISAWSLPPGHSYNNRMDRVVDASGVPVELDAAWYANATESVKYIPTKASQETQAMLATGLLPAGSRDVFILANDIAAVESAWAIEIGDERYHLRAKDGVPGDAATVYRLRLAHE